MALRFANKITGNTLQNLAKVLWPYRVENCKHSTFNKINNDAGAKEIKIQTGQVFSPSTHIPQMQSLKKSTDEKIQSRFNAIPSLEPESRLQSSTKSTEVQDASPETQELKPPMSMPEYQQFEKSTTYKNVKLPLKSTRLARPFPDPVKVMPSDTMSDQEKANQKTAEARLKCDVGSGVNMTNFLTQRRYYSSVMPDDKKCKKESSKKCPSLRVACKAKSKNCDRDYPFKKCSKKNAPYPAYSEFCHTIPDEKPSECKMCPWKPTDHPTFKPPKKKYHTSSITLSSSKWFSSKYEVNTNFKNNENLKNCEEQNLLMEAKDINLTSNPETIFGNAPSVLLEENKRCKKPSSYTCPAESQQKEKNKTKTKNTKTSKKSGKTKKPSKKKAISNTSTDSAFVIALDKSWISFTDQDYPRELKKESYLLQKKGKKIQSGTGKCKKIPAGDCKYKPKPAVGVRRCPKPTRPKVRKIDGCPDPCKKTSSVVENTVPEFMYAKSKSGKDCPPKSICKDETKKDEDPDDPCGLKKKGTTKKCPGDLLVKRRRRPKPPKKKSESVTTTLPLTIAKESVPQQEHLK